MIAPPPEACNSKSAPSKLWHHDAAIGDTVLLSVHPFVRKADVSRDLGNLAHVNGEMQRRDAVAATSALNLLRTHDHVAQDLCAPAASALNLLAHLGPMCPQSVSVSFPNCICQSLRHPCEPHVPSLLLAQWVSIRHSLTWSTSVVTSVRLSVCPFVKLLSVSLAVYPVLISSLCHSATCVYL